jgi:hypothetical protein
MFLTVANHNKAFVSKTNHPELTNMQIRGKFENLCSGLRVAILKRSLSKSAF